MREHYRDPIRLTDIAGAASLSTAYFSTQFHRQAGRTVRDHLNMTRINAAKQLLADTSGAGSPT